MRTALACAFLLVGSSVVAQKPWETHVDLRVPLPIEFPSVPTVNPFAAPLESPPAPRLTPLLEKYVDTFTATAAAYIASDGATRRIVVLKTPWPGVSAALQAALSSATFSPGRAAGAPAATWLPITIDLKGRIDEGRLLRLVPTVPDRNQVPAVERPASPAAEAADLALEATRVEQLEVLPGPKRFRAKLESRTWQAAIRLLVEVSPEGRCSRVVFLSCPDGLRPWLLSSLGTWTFTPGQSSAGPIAAWLQVDAELQVETGTLLSEALRVSRTSSYPYADGQPGGGLPPGA